MLENGLEYCNCPKEHCERFGLCQECIDYHEAKNALPFCKRNQNNEDLKFVKYQNGNSKKN